MLDDPLRSVAVVGGGIVAWSAAVAIRRRLPGVRVTLVATPPSPDALADRMACTLPSAIGFHDDLGLGEDDAVVRAGSGWRLGTRFDGWAQGSPPYVHAYGAYGQPFGTASFHHHWVRAARGGTAAPFDEHAPSAMLARAGRIAPPDMEPGSPFAGVQAGLVLDLPRYEQMLRAFGRHLGLEVRDGEVREVRLRGADGFIDALLLGDGGMVEADLFVDATGPTATLRTAIDAEWEDWSAWLRCDRIMQAEVPAGAVSPLDHVTALAAGWQWRVDAPGRVLHGICYASADLGDAEAADRLTEAGGVSTAETICFRQGTRTDPWVRNCVAIGDAATVIEPLEWTNLHLAHSAIDRIIAMMPGRACHPLETADYNRQTQAETTRVRDFVLCHYAVARRPEPFWQIAADLPPSLERTLRLFAERGRLPFFEEETFTRDSWLAVLLGQGMLPRQVDPLIDGTPPDRSDAAMAAYRAAIARSVAHFPTAADHMAAQSRRIVR
ncbi:tryptophan halogenase [Sphingomonas gellani]|uniref:Tryptophan halogenase n=1 Tax=Sphingomonas gellani TaxID=1166340 RepID=A0A1H8DH43_9SPHN|nr:tryptophan halogenase family protein [Sphingomonas gellani]SEN06563.1 tryptophan halogenase [Sphingomonas gellani]